MHDIFLKPFYFFILKWKRWEKRFRNTIASVQMKNGSEIRFVANLINFCGYKSVAKTMKQNEIKICY